MKRHFLAQLNREVSRLCLGSMVFRAAPLERTFEMLDAFVAAGGNLLDTAEVYGSEWAIAEWIGARGNRAEIVILDKACENPNDITPEGIRDGIAGNLDRLRSDYIDIWMLHRDNPDRPVEMIIDVLNEEIERGRIRSFGGSNWPVRRIVEANRYAEAHGLVGMIGSSPHLSLAVPKEPRWPGVHALTPEEFEWHRKAQFPLFPWSSQAGGFFSGRFTPDDTSNAEMVRVYYSDENFERLRRAEKLGATKGATAIQIALAYILHQPFPTFPLVGPANSEELRSCIDAERLSLTQAEVEWLELRRETL